jgi:signal transduction histidine kinase
MIRWGIRARVLALALLPVTLVAVALALYFVVTRLDDLEQALVDRGSAIARQLAPATEFGVFSDNRDVLERLANAALQEADVVRVAITDSDGGILVQAGKSVPLSEGAVIDGGTQRDDGAEPATLLFAAPILQAQTLLEDEFAVETYASAPSAPRVVGNVYVEMSRAALMEQKRRLLRSGVAITVVVMFVSALLALRLGLDISRPILALAGAVQRIGRGELGTRVPGRSSGELLTLEQGVNEMADALKASREELEERVARATAELVQKRAEAELASRTKTRFLAAASHDLRQPMHALGLFVSVLKQREIPGETAQLVSLIEQSVESLQRLLDALLDISKLDAGVVTPARSAFAVGPLLERLCAEHARQAADKRLRLKLRPSGHVVYSDPTLVERIVRNLVSNALRYTEHGGVLLGCRRRGAELHVEVWDTGIGIPVSHVEQVFEEFYQVGNPERDRKRGLGLGLAIVKRLAQLLGHEIRVGSRVGHGSVFRVALPLAPGGQQACEQTAGDAIEDEDDIAGRVIAVIDDDASVRHAMLTLLEEWGCRAVVAESGAEAAGLLEAAALEPDAIVADYHLRGGETGVDAIRILRQRAGRDVPAIILTGDTGIERQYDAAARAFMQLYKPVPPAKLRSSLVLVLVKEGPLPRLAF